MLDNNLYNKKSPKYYVRKYFVQNKHLIINKTIVDFPSGNGVMSEFLRQLGANVIPLDLFPEYFSYNSLTCQRADIEEGIPLNNQTIDIVLCQEGIEHFPDQLFALKEFSRILKENGILILTTPSYSNIAAKFSYLLFESETFKQMPPNEIDDIWFYDKQNTKKIYYGHIFLIGIQKLRTLASLANLDLKEVKYMRLSKSSLALFPIFYPFIVISSFIRYFFKVIKIENNPNKKSIICIYKQQLKLNINPKHLLNKHSFLIFQKNTSINDTILLNQQNFSQFSGIT